MLSWESVFFTEYMIAFALTNDFIDKHNAFIAEKTKGWHF